MQILQHTPLGRILIAAAKRKPTGGLSPAPRTVVSRGSACLPNMRVDVWCLDNTLSLRRRSLALTRLSLDLHKRRMCSLIQCERVARHFGVISSTDPSFKISERS